MTKKLAEEAEKLLQELQSTSSSKREQAALRLGELNIRDSRIIEALENVVLSDGSKYVQDAAKEALHMIEKKLPAGEISDINQPDVIFCVQCGVTLPADAKFCFKCGKSTERQNQPYFPQKENIATPPQSKEPRCPQCRRTDKVEKVSSIIISQTREVSGGGWQTEVFVDKKGHKQSEDYYSSYDGTEESLLAQKLVPPTKPTNRSGESFAIFLIIFGVFVIFAGFVGIRIWESNVYIFFLVGVILMVMGIISVRNFDREHKNKIPDWEKAMAQWNKLYYCYRDDCVFIPSKNTSAPISEMKAYIYQTD